IGLAEIIEERIQLWIDVSVDWCRHRPSIRGRWRRNSDLRRAPGVGGNELEMLDHRVAGKADLSGDFEPLVARRHRRESNSGVHHMFLDAIETPEEIEMPPGAAEFAIGDRLQPTVFLLLDDAFDFAVLDFLELRGR